MDQQELFSLMERPVLRDLEAYSVATIRALKIRLSANENNFGPPPLVVEAAALAALDEEDYYDGLRRTIVAEREKLCGLMESLGMPFIPSQANFVALLPGQQRQELDRALAGRAIAVRPFSLEGTAALRISIGTAQENLVLAEALR